MNSGVTGAGRGVSSVPLLALTLCLTALPAPALGQQPSKPRVGYLASSSYVHPAFQDLFILHITTPGLYWGGNVTLLSRSAAGRDDRLPGLATELVDARVDVVLAEGVAAGLAAKAATRTIPIVMAISGDPVQAGLVASLARPGGNVTGVTSLSPELVAKRLQLVTEIVPNASRVAVLWNPASPGKELEWKALRAAATQLGIALQPLELRQRADLESRLDDAVKQSAGAVLLLDDSLTLSLAFEITTEIEKRRLPAIYGWDRYTGAGNSGLMAYGPTVWDLTTTAATYVDKILKGAKPRDLPVEQPNKFELVINVKTAKALGLTIPQSLLLRVDRVIE